MFQNDMSLMVGRTLESVEDNGEEMTFVCTDGSAFSAYHSQDCCESVRIYDVSGDPKSLLGSPITEATEDVLTDWPEGVPKSQYIESFTWTIHTFRTATATVTVRWLGTSSGYYSESVYFNCTHKPIALKEEVDPGL